MIWHLVMFIWLADWKVLSCSPVAIIADRLEGSFPLFHLNGHIFSIQTWKCVKIRISKESRHCVAFQPTTFGDHQNLPRQWGGRAEQDCAEGLTNPPFYLFPSLGPPLAALILILIIWWFRTKNKMQLLLNVCGPAIQGKHLLKSIFGTYTLTTKMWQCWKVISERSCCL